MLLDLVSPWTAAVEANDTAGQATFRARHSLLLDLLRREHAPHARHLPLLSDPIHLNDVARSISRPVFRQVMESTQQRAEALGADIPTRVVLLPIEAATEPVTVVPHPESLAILGRFSGDATDALLAIPLARALAKLTRWRAPDSESAVRQHLGEWDRWELARDIPLREWLYAEGVGWHLALALNPEMPPHQLFGLGTGAWQRLREQEGAARTQLAHELDQRGVGLVMRWLLTSNAVPVRGFNGQTMPPEMGHYLAWRMTAPRVARIGIAAAIRAVA